MVLLLIRKAEIAASLVASSIYIKVKAARYLLLLLLHSLLLHLLHHLLKLDLLQLLLLLRVYKSHLISLEATHHLISKVTHWYELANLLSLIALVLLLLELD